MLSIYYEQNNLIDKYKELTEKIEYLDLVHEIFTTHNIKSTLSNIYHRYASDIIRYQMFTGIGVHDFLWINYIQNNSVTINKIFDFVSKIFIVLKCKSEFENTIFKKLNY